MPVPEPFVEVELAVVGNCEVLQQIPRAVIGAPPSPVISPPPEAVEAVNSSAADVDNVGNNAGIARMI